MQQYDQLIDKIFKKNIRKIEPTTLKSIASVPSEENHQSIKAKNCYTESPTYTKEQRDKRTITNDDENYKKSNLEGSTNSVVKEEIPQEKAQIDIDEKDSPLNLTNSRQKKNGLTTQITETQPEKFPRHKKKHKLTQTSNSSQSRYEKYNTENLAYEAYRNFSQCRPSEKEFLSRMKFYAIKTQKRNEIVKVLVDKNKPTIKESERIKTFNHLIEDSNRRAEAKNRIEMLNKNKKIASEIYDSDRGACTGSSRKKFNVTAFELKYKKNVTEKLEKRKKMLEEQKKLKEKEEKEKEDKIVAEMKKYNRKASREKIDLISQRLYSEANKRQIKRDLLSQSSRDINNIQAFKDFKLSAQSRQSSKRSLRKEFKPKLHHKSEYNFNGILKQESFLSDFTDLQQKDKKTKRTHTSGNTLSKENNKKSHRKNNSNLIASNQRTGRDMREKFIPFQNAEKMVEAFFLHKK